MESEPALSARDPRVLRAVGLLRRGAAAEPGRPAVSPAAPAPPPAGASGPAVSPAAPAPPPAVALDGPDLIAAAREEGLAFEFVLAAEPAAWAHLGAPVAAASPDALRALGALGQPAEVVAVARLPAPPPPALPPAAIVLAGVTDAGNVGSILRSAAAFGAPRAVLCNCADPWARRALRAAMGASLRPGLVAFADSLAAVAALAGRAPLAAAVARDGVAPDALPPGCAVVLGSERDGLSGEERALCEHSVTIPAHGFESLNVAAAAAVLLSAISRQRRRIS